MRILGHRLILLKEKEGNPKYMLPIWIGQPEALAIQWKLQGKAPSRPMTHDLMKNIIEHLNATVDAVYVHTIEDSTYFGRINLKSNGKTLEIDARSSDAIALALRFEAPIYVAEQVIQKTGFPETELNTAEEQQPEESRQHILSAPTAPPLGRPPELLVGRPAPAFTLTDLEGKLVSLSDFKKKAILLDFWATWCPPCVKEIPHFITLYEQYKDQGFEVVGISVDREGVEVVKSFAEQHRINYPILMSNQRVIQRYGGVPSIPTTFLINNPSCDLFIEYVSELNM